MIQHSIEVYISSKTNYHALNYRLPVTMLTGWYAGQFDVLAVIRPRRESVRRLLVEKHWQKDGREKEDKNVTETQIMADLTNQL